MKFNYKSHFHENIITHPKKKINKKDMYNLSSNELLHEDSFDLNKTIMEEFNNRNLVNKYPYFPSFIKEYSDHIEISEEQVLLSSGSDDAIKTIIEAITTTTNNLIIPYPDYENYIHYAALRNIKVKTINLKMRDDYLPVLNTSLIEKVLLDSPPSTLVISNPNGFNGKALSYSEIYEICNTANNNNHIVIIDEAYGAFENIEHKDLLKVFRNIIILKSFSKKFGVAGLRLAAIISSSKIIDYLKNWNIPNNLSYPSLYFVKEINKKQEVFKNIYRDINDTKKYIINIFNDCSDMIKVSNSSTNFLTLKFTSSTESEKFVDYMYANKIIVRNLDHIEEMKGCVRMTIGSQKYMSPIIPVLKDYLINLKES